MSKRIFGKKIDFKSLSCAPVNEHGVVYLFGLLHDSFDFKIESIQAGFPDCIARREKAKDRWEELRIEFESKSFFANKHDINGADMIVCWKHNWKDCPKYIEVIELSTMIGDLEEINKSIEDGSSKLSDYQLFCREKRLQGLTLKEISPLWNAEKKKLKSKPKEEKPKEEKPKEDKSKEDKSKEPLTAYQKFTKEKVISGLTLKEAANLWQEKKKK